MDSQLVQYLQGQSMIGGYGTMAGAQNNPYVLYNRLTPAQKTALKFTSYNNLTKAQKKKIVKDATLLKTKYTLQKLRNKAKENGMILSHIVDGKRKAFTKAELLTLLGKKKLL